jgi:hypothetical protein
MGKLPRPTLASLNRILGLPKQVLAGFRNIIDAILCPASEKPTGIFARLRRKEKGEAGSNPGARNKESQVVHSFGIADLN